MHNAEAVRTSLLCHSGDAIGLGDAFELLAYYLLGEGQNGRCGSFLFLQEGRHLLSGEVVTTVTTVTTMTR